MAREDDDIDRVWALMRKISFCMLSTHDGQDIRSRPMSAHVEREEDAIYFLTDITSHKDDDIERNPNVGLAFADPGGQKFVAPKDAQYWDSPGLVLSYISMVAAAVTSTRPAVGNSAKVKL